MRMLAASIHYASIGKSLGALKLILLGHRKKFDQVNEYEKRFREAEGATYSVATSMGRIAFFHILQGLKLCPGDSILLSPVNIPEMLAVIQVLKLKPVFVDFDTDTLFPSTDLFKTAAEADRPKAAMITIIAGQIGNLSSISDYCKAHDIPLIIDATQANLSRYKDRPLTCWAEYVFYSTCELKFVHTFRGAMICTDHLARYEAVLKKVSAVILPQKIGRLLKKWFLDSAAAVALNPLIFGYFFRWFSSWIFTQDPERFYSQKEGGAGLVSFFDCDYREMMDGIPKKMFFRVSNYEAHSGMRSIIQIKRQVDRHRRVAESYKEILSRTSIIPKTDLSSDSSYWRFPILLPTEKAAKEFRWRLKKRGILAEKIGLSLLSQDVPQAKSAISRTLLIPCHAGLSERHIARVGYLCDEIFEELCANTQK